MSLPESDLPLWIIFAAPATYPWPPDVSMNRFATETRDFDCVLYVCIAQAGIDGEAERKVEPYLDAARNLIQIHPLLYSNNMAQIVPGIMRAGLVRDSGIASLRFNPRDPSTYAGVRYTIRVEGKNILMLGDE